MSFINIEELLNSQVSIDTDLREQSMFSPRTTKLLLRNGIITLRLLVGHTLKHLCNDIEDLGETGLLEIEQTLSSYGLELNGAANENDVILSRLLTKTYASMAVPRPLDMRLLTKKVNQVSRTERRTHIRWSISEVGEGVKWHPYIQQLEDGRLFFHLGPVEIDSLPLDFGLDDSEASERLLPTMSELRSDSMALQENTHHSEEADFEELSSDESTVEPETVLLDPEINDGARLYEIWGTWIEQLSEQERTIISLLYGISGDESFTLRGAGDELDITGERVRQIRDSVLRQLMRIRWWALRLLIDRVLSHSVERSSNLLTSKEWEDWLDGQINWSGAEPRPFLLKFMCDVSGEFHYLERYHLVTVNTIKSQHLDELGSQIKRCLRKQKEKGLTAQELVSVVKEQLSPYSPDEIGQADFILKSVGLFDSIRAGHEGRYFYRKNKKSLNLASNLGWAGKPGSELNEWERKLRKDFESVDWVGQIPLAEDSFRELCQVIQREAQAPNYFSKITEGQPKLVPPAVFLTTMVFSARYSDDLPEEAVDEFWAPYLRSVWNTEYSQAFYVRCKKRFHDVEAYLEREFNFAFPRVGSSGGVVTPVFRHALIPRYMQSDFARWLSGNWHMILMMAETPNLLATQLREDPSLNHGNYSHRLGQFIVGNTTSEAATALISNMAAAVDLYINDGQSIEAIRSLLADSPIEQELWEALSRTFGPTEEDTQDTSMRLTKPRLTWVWSLDEDELVLRVQNIVLSAMSGFEGELDRVVWVASGDDDLMAANIEVAVTPWRMKSGEHIVPDLFIEEPDGPLNGQLVLLTDMDEVIMRLDVPTQPTNDMQFFRITQQGAYGIPIEINQLKDDTYLVCAIHEMIFLDREDEREDYGGAEPDFTLNVPYPLEKRYGWAAQITLSLPVTAIHGAIRVTLTQTNDQTTIVKSSLVGMKPIVGLSRQVQPTFTDTEVVLQIDRVADDLPKQAMLWLQGQDGWRFHCSLTQLRQQGHLSETENGLNIYLGHILPERANFYTVELRASLQPLLRAPLQFAVIPDMFVETISDEIVYTPATPFKILLHNVDTGVVVRSKGLSVEQISDTCQQVTWYDYRYDPRLFLRFDKIEIPLAWSVPQFMAWLEPKPQKSFLTLHDLRQTTLHAVCRHADVGSFALSLAEQNSRFFPLTRGRYDVQLGRSQLVDMVIGSQTRHTIVNVRAGNAMWSLLEVRRRPQLPQISVSYDNKEKTVSVSTGLDEAWAGNVRFLVRSLTNPFAPNIVLERTSQLNNFHQFFVSLAEGIFLLQIELDDVSLALDENQMRFTVGSSSFDMSEHSQELLNEIRNGTLISPRLAEDFVLWWAELASVDAIELTPTTLYQLSSIPVKALENFTKAHLEELWTPLASLKDVSHFSTQVGERFLPAWIFLSTPLLFKTHDRGFRLRIYPVQISDKGFRGKGYGQWHLSPEEHSSKDFVFVQWKPAFNISEISVHIEAGLPQSEPDDWGTVDLLDTYSLLYCVRCGRLTGVSDTKLPDEMKEAHRHGQDDADLYDINLSEEYGGYRLVADLFHDRNGEALLDVFEEFNLPIHTAISVFPEPIIEPSNTFPSSSLVEHLAVITRELLWYSTNSKANSPWASVDRLFSRWSQEKCVSQFGRYVVGLGMLLRTAAHDPNVYYRLLKRANLSEKDTQDMLAEITKKSTAYVKWGLTWAELLIEQSPGTLQ